MNHYVEEADDWMRGMPGSLSYHATLENHHHSLDSHAPTYPSQQLSHSGTIHGGILDPVAPLMESPSYSQDRDSISESVDDENSVPPLPSYQLSHSGGIPSIPPTPPQSTCPNPFKRPYQPDPTPGSSPQQSSSMPPHPKRRKSASKEAWTMTEDDNLLLQLKDDEGLPWKTIAQRFRDMNRGEFRVPTLQMRYKRLKEKMRVWDADDIQYLKEAKDYVEKQKWEIISQKMLELGCKKKIPASTCEKKWKEIGPQQQPQQQQSQQQPVSQPLTPQPVPLQAHEMKRELSEATDEG